MATVHLALVGVTMRTELSSADEHLVAVHAVVVGLFHAVRAFVAGLLRRTAFVVGNLTEAGRVYVLHFAVLASVCHDLVRVRADEVTLEAMEVR